MTDKERILKLASELKVKDYKLIAERLNIEEDIVEYVLNAAIHPLTCLHIAVQSSNLEFKKLITIKKKYKKRFHYKLMKLVHKYNMNKE